MTSTPRPAWHVTHAPTGEDFYVLAEEEFQAKATVFRLKGFSSKYAGGTLSVEPVPEELWPMIAELHEGK